MSQRRKAGTGPGGIAPLYQRLPHGPHQLGPREVARNQRLRIYGAMIEAVAADGYAGTSVKQVLALAGVSRRTFYEQFANKQECFLATFDVIAAGGARRIGNTYRRTSGGAVERLHVCFQALTASIGNNSKRATLAIVEAQTAGALGLARLRAASAAFEQMLCSTLAHAPDTRALPMPLVRGIVGGVNHPIAQLLRERRAEEIPLLAQEMLAFTLLYQTAALEQLSASLLARAHSRRLACGPGPTPQRGRARVSAREGADPTAPAPNGEATALATAAEDPAERLSRSVLELAASECYDALTVAEIAEHAAVSTDTFAQFYPGKEACFLAGFERVSEKLLSVTTRPARARDDQWTLAVRSGIDELMQLLAAQPLYAHTLARVAPSVGGDALARDLRLVGQLATMLTRRAPGAPATPLAREAIAGAIWHTIRCHVASDNVHLLPALADYLSYIVLAPYIGADSAARLLIEQEPLPALA
jgi:AcrR family transcriptional regulator